MILYVPRVIEKPGSALVVGRVLAHGVEVRDERYLRVDDDLLLAGKPHDDVGSEHISVFARRRALFVEVAMLDHSGHLDDALELDLSPAPAHVGLLQGGGEIPGFDAEPILVAAKQRHAFGELSIGLVPDPLDTLKLSIHPLERVLEGAHISRQT